MDLPRLCGQLLCVGFEGTSAPPELLARVARGEVGSVVLFRPNVEGPGQVAGVVGALRRAAPADQPLLVAVDQEGGLVQRIRAPATEWPDMMSVGEADDPARSRAVGQAIGVELGLLGVGWNFAPVLDVHTNPQNPVIGRRAFGTHPETVSRHALAFWEGLRAAGVHGCGKHYPGHGETNLDSHHHLPRMEGSSERLASVELVPFKAAIAAGAEALMSAHVLYPALDPDNPATLSRVFATTWLRERLGFHGVLVSDDLGMAAVADRWSIEELVVEAVAAGVDHLIVRGPLERQQQAFEHLLRTAGQDPAFRASVTRSAERVAALKAAGCGPWPASPAEVDAVFPIAAHRILAASFGPSSPAGPSTSPVTRY